MVPEVRVHGVGRCRGLVEAFEVSAGRVHERQIESGSRDSPGIARTVRVRHGCPDLGEEWVYRAACSIVRKKE